MTVRPGRLPVWWVRSVRPPADPVAGDASTVVVHAIATDERPDRSVVEVDDLPPGRTVATGRLGRVAMRSDTLQLLRSELTTPTGAPPLVLVERIVRDASPVLAELIAFPHAVVAVRAATFGADVAPGSVLTLADAARIGLAAEDQVGAVKWRAGTGQVLEVYVAPAHRRRGVATFLLFSAEGAAAARGWPRLWGGGVRTALGEALVTRLRWGVGRVAPLAEVAPPMTPVEDTLGVPRRHLEPLD